jgi:hypothetical protein
LWVYLPLRQGLYGLKVVLPSEISNLLASKAEIIALAFQVLGAVILAGAGLLTFMCIM